MGATWSQAGNDTKRSSGGAQLACQRAPFAAPSPILESCPRRNFHFSERKPFLIAVSTCRNESLPRALI